MRALAASLCAFVLPASAATTVAPARVEAGSFYSGATLHVRGSIGEQSQVAIRVTGPREHHHFNRRGRIGGIIWGGIEHVTFRHAPSLYALHTSAALEALAPAALRQELELGYDTLEARIDVEGQRSDKPQLVEHFVRLKESEGLYLIAPGAVRLAEARQGRRAFEASVQLPGAAPPGEVEVAVLELASGALVGKEVTRVRIERVGLPAFLIRMAHERSALFGMLAVVALVLTGVGVDLLGSRKSARPHPAAVVLSGIGRGFDDTLLAARHRPRSPAQVEELHRKYRLFRTLLSLNNEVLENLADVEEESTWTSFRHTRVRMGIRALFDGTADMVSALNQLTSERYFDLRNVVATLRADVFRFLEKSDGQDRLPLVLRSEEIGSDTAARVGDKAVGLARIESDLGVRVPGSFAVTIDAYREFMESGGIASQLRTILSPARLDAPADLGRRCLLARAVILEAEVPAPVADAIKAAYRASGFPEGEGLAVRSSAAGEGGELSFAGQFESYLNVPPAQLVETWKKVIASRFSPRAVFYRRAAGLAEVDTPMAVLVQRMVRARASGVAFTRPPDDARAPGILVAAARGLGPDVSLGVASADQLVVSRSFPHRILDRRIAPKRARLQPDDHGGVRRLAVAPLEQLQASITDAQAARLARTALEIERYFGTPQDIEWAFDEAGQLFVLQARALRTGKADATDGEVECDAPVLLRGGEPVWQGRAVGPVHVARTPEEEDETPPGALLVVPQLLPDCVRLLPRVCGIVVERGTITGHAASILREFRIPSLFGLTGAADQLVPGRVVSLDVASRAIFDGALWPELRGQLPARILGGRTAGLPDLLAGKLTKLSGSAFVGTWACQSLHDVIRFAHEMAIQSMFEIGDRLLESPIGGVKKV
ncbi:MAG: TIGR02186 family protein, partial [Deltaproteobacteria bacterium]